VMRAIIARITNCERLDFRSRLRISSSIASGEGLSAAGSAGRTRGREGGEGLRPGVWRGPHQFRAMAPQVNQGMDAMSL